MGGVRRVWLCVAVALLVVGCASGGDPAPDAAPPSADPGIRVGAFNFPESVLLAELYAQVLRSEDLPVAEVRQLGSREIVQPALQQGLVDLVPEYLGSAVVFLTGESDASVTDATTAQRTLERAMGERGVTVGPVAAAQNRNAFAVSQETAERLDLRQISDLAGPAPQMVLGGPPECQGRRTCLEGLRDVYDIEFSRFLSLERTDHVAAALAGGEIDVGVMFSTDPAVLSAQVVVLEDDRRLQPAENVVPVFRDEILERYGTSVLDALARVSAELTTRELARVNRELAEGDGTAAEVARTWLEAHGITP